MLGIEVTIESQYHGASCSRELFGALREFVEVMKGSDPQPSSILKVEIACVKALGTTLLDEAEIMEISYEYRRKKISRSNGNQ